MSFLPLLINRIMVMSQMRNGISVTCLGDQYVDSWYIHRVPRGFNCPEFSEINLLN